jgi:aminoglycoside phosphotransferase (APT) family kinase protein
MIDPSDPNQVGTALLRYLRDALEAPGLAYIEQPQPIFGGNRTFVYGFQLGNAPEEYSGPLILRVLRPAEDPESVPLEAGAQAALVDLGYPAPLVLHWSTEPDRLGGPFQVMIRLPGDGLVLANPPEEMTGFTLLRQLLPEFRRLLFGPWPGLLAEIQVRLHELDVDAFREKLSAHGFSQDRITLASHIERFADAVDSHSIEGLRAGLEWLRGNRPDATSASVCHGDFFPNQVLAQDGRVTGVIDWGDVMIAPAELDVGIVRTGLETLAPPLGRPGTALQGWLARKYVAAYERLRPLDPSLLGYGDAFRCFRTLLWTAVRRMAVAGAVVGEPGPNPYDNSVSEGKICSRFERLTGIKLSIPGG